MIAARFGTGCWLALLILTASTPAPAQEVFLTPAMSVNELRNAQQDTDRSLLVVDVRPSKEYRTGHIPGAINLPYKKIGKEPERLRGSETVVLYCLNGKRTRKAEQILAEHAVAGLYHLEGSLIAWRQQGFPVTTGWKP